MKEAIVARVISSWDLPSDQKKAWLELAAMLEEAHIEPGQVLWFARATETAASGEMQLACALYAACLSMAHAQGHTLLDLDSPRIQEAARRLEAAAGVEGARWSLAETGRRYLESGGNSLCGRDIHTPFVLEDKALQTSRTRWMEAECARMLQERMQAPVQDTALPGADAGLDEAQARMVQQALSRRVFWVSGGPGTGKTTCIYGMLHALSQLSPPVAPERVAIAAPTGKAAFRAAESLRRMAERGHGEAAQWILQGRVKTHTLHRLLEHQPETGRFGRHGGRPLDVERVIVDESSMVDLELLHALLSALPPETGVVFVGDFAQLPAVGLGAPFSAVWEVGPRCAPAFFFRLEHNYRAQQALFQDVAALLENENTLPWRQKTLPDMNAEGVFLHEIADDADLQAFLEAVFSSCYPPEYWENALQVHALPEKTLLPEEPGGQALMRLVRQAQASPVLCAVHDGQRGIRQINEFFHRRHPEGGAGLLPGEPVMMQANDYMRGLFNGDCGVVVDASIKGQNVRCAVFADRDRLRVFELAGLPLERAYAFSVHKSQGSEYERLSFVLPEAPMGLVTRELVYTALTRARRAVYVAGSPPVLNRALRSVVKRHMRLTQWMFPCLSAVTLPDA